MIDKHITRAKQLQWRKCKRCKWWARRRYAKFGIPPCPTGIGYCHARGKLDEGIMTHAEWTWEDWQCDWLGFHSIGDHVIFE